MSIKCILLLLLLLYFKQFSLLVFSECTHSQGTNPQSVLIKCCKYHCAATDNDNVAITNSKLGTVVSSMCSIFCIAQK